MVVVEVGGRVVVFGLHAVRRWQERFAPLLSVCGASERLRRSADRAQIGLRRPNGIRPGNKLRQQLETVAWLIVDDAVFPLVQFGDELVATTCIARGSR